MIRTWYRIRKFGWSALCALLLMCVCAAGQSTTPATSAQKAQTPAAATGTTAKKTAAHPSNSSPSSSSKTPSSQAQSTTHSASAHSSSTGKRPSRKKKTSRVRGQQKIDSERATAIQQALIREHYLSGDPAGTWNQASEEAMRRYQADHGWQTKEVPDSRALIKLGLGPSNAHLLNPESAMTSSPPTPHAAVVAPPAQNAPIADPAPVSAPTTSPSPQ